MKVWEAHLRCRAKHSEDGWAATTTAIIMGVMAAAGAAASAAGSYSSSQAQKATADFNSKVAKNNALAAEQQATAEAGVQRQRTERLRGAQAAAFAKAGVSGGSAQDVAFDTSVQGELDALTTMYRGSIEGGYQRSQSQLFQYQGQNAMTAGYWGAAGSLLSGAGGAYRTYSAIRNNQPDFGYG